MTEVVYDALTGAVDIPGLGVRCEAGVPVELPDDIAAELVERGEFKLAAKSRAATTKGKE